MGQEHGGTWHMDAAQLDTQRKKGEAILKTSSTTLLDRPSFNSIELRSQSDSPHGSDGIAGKDPLRAPISLALEMRSKGLDGLVWAMILWPPRFDSHWLTPCF
ncbi:unnamed protein product [Microthlaspi erraticum]|uniref:Uncharacterized protein n=1 Tax=Microthlaspi erraticum TaxID=1685480 RepID=A0A6D2ISU0_9BRAS|nr:unnamed protein product [Microthlaspi erraticum]